MEVLDAFADQRGEHYISPSTECNLLLPKVPFHRNTNKVSGLGFRGLEYRVSGLWFRV